MEGADEGKGGSKMGDRRTVDGGNKNDRYRMEDREWKMMCSGRRMTDK